MGTKERNPLRKKKVTKAVRRIFPLRLQPRCHAAFYISDLCSANVQIAFLSAIPGTFETLNGHNISVTAGLICQDITLCR